MLSPNLSAKLKAKRACGRLTLEQVAARTGVPTDTIYGLEIGAVPFPEPHDLYYLGKLYGIDYIELMIDAGHIIKKPESVG